MARKRLTSETLHDFDTKEVSVRLADLSARLLGKSATDNELVSVGTLLYKKLGTHGVRDLHRVASRILTASGEGFGLDDKDPDDDGLQQHDPSKTQDYVTSVTTKSNNAVLNTAMNSTPKDIHDMKTAAKRKAKQNILDPKELDIGKPSKIKKEEEDLDEDEEDLDLDMEDLNPIS